jgi:hypothetical protein
MENAFKARLEAFLGFRERFPDCFGFELWIEALDIRGGIFAFMFRESFSPLLRIVVGEILAATFLDPCVDLSRIFADGASADLRNNLRQSTIDTDSHLNLNHPQCGRRKPSLGACADYR